MKYLIVEIIEFTDDGFPGFVKCKFIDALGKTWNFYEKAPVVSFENITKNTILPRNGYIAGEILHEENGIIYFSTEKPDYIETDDGENKFYVFKNQIIDKINLSDT
jgi:hypothetical protein